MNYQDILETIYSPLKEGENQGATATYIPELPKVDPEKFGVNLTTVNNQSFSVGGTQEKFSIQSIVKALSFCMAYQLQGETIWKRLGYEPSGTGSSNSE